VAHADPPHPTKTPPPPPRPPRRTPPRPPPPPPPALPSPYASSAHSLACPNTDSGRPAAGPRCRLRLLIFGWRRAAPAEREKDVCEELALEVDKDNAIDEALYNMQLGHGAMRLQQPFACGARLPPRYPLVPRPRRCASTTPLFHNVGHIAWGLPSPVSERNSSVCCCLD